MTGHLRSRLGLLAALAGGGCFGDDAPPDPVIASSGPRHLFVSARNECCWPGKPRGITVRVALGIEIDRVLDPRLCPRLADDLRVLVNERETEILDRGGPTMGGIDGALFMGCRRTAIAEVGPFTQQEARTALVRVVENGVTAEATIPGLVLDIPLLSSAPRQVRLASEAVIPADGPSSVGRELGFWDFDTPDGVETFTSWVASAALPGPPGLRVRAVGRPGRARLEISGTSDDVRSLGPESCPDFSGCEVQPVTMTGLIDMDVTP